MKINLSSQFLVLLLCVSCATVQEKQSKKETDNVSNSQLRPMNSDAFVSPSQIPVLQNEALIGNGEAAFRLSMHYAYGTFDAAEALQWETVAIEDGNTKAMYFRRQLMDSSNPQARVRARYWFERLKADSTYGEKARSSLRDMDPRWVAE